MSRAAKFRRQAQRPDSASLVLCLLGSCEVSEFLGVSQRQLRRWRAQGKNSGPPFLRLGGRSIRYRFIDVLNFIAEGIADSQKDAKPALRAAPAEHPKKPAKRRKIAARAPGRRAASRRRANSKRGVRAADEPRRGRKAAR